MLVTRMKTVNSNYTDWEGESSLVSSSRIISPVSNVLSPSCFGPFISYPRNSVWNFLWKVKLAHVITWRKKSRGVPPYLLSPVCPFILPCIFLKPWLTFVSDLPWSLLLTYLNERIDNNSRILLWFLTHVPCFTVIKNKTHTHILELKLHVHWCADKFRLVPGHISIRLWETNMRKTFLLTICTDCILCLDLTPS